MGDKVSKQHILITAALLLLTFAGYMNVQNYEFINFDDDLYVTENQIVKTGLSFNGLSWAFGFNGGGYYQPLTWLSHMLDCEIYGLDPAGHHLTNLVIHLANVLLLFWALYRMTDSIYKSCLAAALFALHPLNVDSVAWIAERKNLLSTLCLMLSLLAYHWYTKQPKPGRYVLTITVFALGLMVKPMLVTFPFVLLLLDFWPLGRLKLGKQKTIAMMDPPLRADSKPAVPIYRLCIEKLPFLALALGAVWLSVASLQRFNNMVATDTVPMALRFANAVVSYLSYIGKMLWPFNLAVYYPFPDSVPLWQTAGCLVLLAAATGYCLFHIERKPYLAVGWFWFLGTLVPVAGIVQSGLWPEMADRWAYVPLIGLYIVIAWGIPGALQNWRFAVPVMTVAALAVIGSLFFITRAQLNHWENSRTLFEHALRVTTANAVAHNNLGNALLEEGQTDTALNHFEVAITLEPRYAGARNNMGNALMALGRVGEAVSYYRDSIHIDPFAAQAHNNLAVALTKESRLDEAFRHLQEALRLKPDYADAYNNLGAVYGKKAQVQKAAKFYLKAIRLRPDFSEAYNNLGLLLWNAGRLKEAGHYFSQAAKLDPDYLAARQNLVKVQSALDDFNKQAAELRSQIQQSPNDPGLYLKLGDHYKSQDQLSESLKQYQLALQIRPGFAPAQQQMAVIYAMKGDYDRAIDILEKLAKHQTDNFQICYYLAGIYARKHNPQDSIYWLKQAIAKGYNNWNELKTDRNFDGIRQRADFRALVAER